MARYLVYIACAWVWLSGCTTSSNQPPPVLTQTEQTSKWDSLVQSIQSTNSNRDAWQKPETVLALLGDIEGKVVADIGAGAGYFTLMLPKLGAKVIAIDIDAFALQGIDQTMNLPNYNPTFRSHIELRQVQENDPELELEEVDAVMVINTIAYIEDRVDYLKKIWQGLKPGGKLLIVDYKKRRITLPIPFEERLPLFQVENEVILAGFDQIVTEDCLLSYQYAITAIKQVASDNNENL